MDRKSWSFNNEDELNMPMGYRFNPTGFEMINYYLVPELKGKMLPPHYIIDLDDPYIYEPHQIALGKLLTRLNENEAFFFISDSRVKSADERRIRNTPNGYWIVYKDNVPIVADDHEVIGFMTKLLYHDAHGNKTDWKMIEYKCHPSQIPTTSTNVKRACKIKLRKK